jgi:hypothetical protein
MSNHVSDSVAILRKLAELKERQGWAHHVADAATGNLHTTELSQPITPLSRAERLSQLGHRFDRSIFGTPTPPAYAETAVPSLANRFPRVPSAAPCVVVLR